MAPWPLSGSWQTRSETCRPPVWRKWGYKRGVDSQTNEADNLVQRFTTALFLSLTSQSAKNMKILESGEEQVVLQVLPLHEFLYHAASHHCIPSAAKFPVAAVCSAFYRDF